MHCPASEYGYVRRRLNREDWVIVVFLLVIAAIAIAGAITNSADLMGVLVIAFGIGCLMTAAIGKPSWPGIGLAEALLHRLPEGPWRIAMVIMGLSIVGIGVMGILDPAT